MSVLDWSFVSLLAAALLFLFFGVLALILFFRTRGKWKQLQNKRPPKNKKKRKRLQRMRQRLENQKKRQRNRMIVFLSFSVVLSSGAFYTRYYQQNHLQGQDSEILVQSYYILEDLTEQLNELEKGETPEKSRKNINDLSGRLASYGTKKSSFGLTEENQKRLNRYFLSLRELGVNLSGQTSKTNVLPTVDAIQGYKADVEKAQSSQTEIFKHFNVNEAALKQKK